MNGNRKKNNIYYWYFHASSSSPPSSRVNRRHKKEVALIQSLGRNENATADNNGDGMADALEVTRMTNDIALANQTNQAGPSLSSPFLPPSAVLRGTPGPDTSSHPLLVVFLLLPEQAGCCLSPARHPWPPPACHRGAPDASGDAP